jgi:hypothetical protein
MADPLTFDHLPNADAASSAPTPLTFDHLPDDGIDADHRAAREWLAAHPEAQHSYVNNVAGRLSQGTTLGFADDLRAGAASIRDSLKHGGMPWDYYSREKAMQDEQLRLAKEQTGRVGDVAEFVGELLPANKIFQGVGKLLPVVEKTLATRRVLLPAVTETAEVVAPRAATLTQRAAAAPLTTNIVGGAVTGGAQAAGDGENILKGSLVGAGGGLLGDRVGKLLGAGVNKVFTREAAPTTKELFDKASAEYAAFDASPGMVTSDGASALAARLKETLSNPKLAFDPALHPNVATAVKNIDRYIRPSAVPDSLANLNLALPAESVQAIRQHTQNAVDAATNKTQRRAAMKVKGAVDDWMSNLSEEAGTVMGGLDVEALRAGNRAFSTASKAEKLDNLITATQKSAAITGRSSESGMRRAAEKLIKRPRGFTNDELNAANQIINGGRVQNAARWAGDNFGLHSPAQALGHAIVGYGSGGTTAVGGLMAELARIGSERATRKKLGGLSELIRSGGRSGDVARAPALTEAQRLKLQRTGSMALPGLLD